MKKLLTITATCALISAPAIAVQKCVAYDRSSTDCSGPTGTALLGKTEWSATCTTNGTSISIVGVGQCSSTSGSVSSPKYNTALSTTATADDNKYCHCRIISPFVSNWVWASTFDTLGACNYACANSCANAISGNNPSWVKVFLFQDISD